MTDNSRSPDIASEFDRLRTAYKSGWLVRDTEAFRKFCFANSDELAELLLRASQPAARKWDEGEHEGCGIDSQRAFERQTRQERVAQALKDAGLREDYDVRLALATAAIESAQPATPTGGEDDCSCGGGEISGHDTSCPYRRSSADERWCLANNISYNDPTAARSSAGSAIARLVVAARKVAFEDQGPEALRELDKASEAFAQGVPWDDEPNAASPSLATVLDALTALYAVAKVCRDEDYAAVTNAAAVIEASRSPNAAQPSAHPADEMIGQIEQRFPNWKSYRDLVDCIDVTLYNLRGSRQ